MRQIKFAGALAATVLMAGSTQATLFAHDTFEASASPSYTEGVYLHGANMTDTNGNATCIDTSTNQYIVGFDSSNAWDAYYEASEGSYFDAYYGVMKLNARTYSQDFIGRRISTNLAAVSKAYAKVSMRIFNGSGGTGGASRSYALAGWCGSKALSSGGGAAVGFNWSTDRSEWDLVIRYSNGSIVYAPIATGIEYDMVYDIYYFMDDSSGIIKVWAEKSSDGNAPAPDAGSEPDLLVEDWYNGTVGKIRYLSTGFAYTGDSDVYIYEASLADRAEDIGMTPPPTEPEEPLPSGLLLRDEFIAMAASDLTNGIYASNQYMTAPTNSTCAGGTIVGFDAAHPWAIPAGQSSGSYFRPYVGAGKLKMLGRKYSGTYLERSLTNSLSGLTKCYAKTTLNMAVMDPGMYSTRSFAWVGFTDDVYNYGSSATSTNNGVSVAAGADVGYVWNAPSNRWELALRYLDGSSTPVVATIRTNVSYKAIYDIYWEMDSESDTIRVWVDKNNVFDEPNLEVNDWTGEVETIDRFAATHSYTDAGSKNHVYVYRILLGKTPESIGMEVPKISGEILGIEPFSSSVMKLVVSSTYPSFCYPKSTASLTIPVWEGIPHSTNGVDGFVATNLDYSATSGTNRVIYIEADQDEKFIKIGAE